MNYICKNCGCDMLTHDNLEHHKYYCATDNTCNRCNEQFPNADNLSSHLNICTKETKKIDSFKCYRCGAQMFIEDHLSSHLSVCGYDIYLRKHQCKSCDRFFFNL